jgi:hypothetical protein
VAALAGVVPRTRMEAEPLPDAGAERAVTLQAERGLHSLARSMALETAGRSFEGRVRGGERTGRELSLGTPGNRQGAGQREQRAAEASPHWPPQA